MTDNRSLDTMASRLQEGAEFKKEAFELRAGQPSNWFFDAKYALRRGIDLQHAGKLMLSRIHRGSGEFTNICAMGIGGYAVMFALVFEAREAEWTMAHKGKADDPDNGLHGADVDGKTIFVVDDVLSTGSSLLDTVCMIREAGGEVKNAFTLATRSSGTAEAAVYDASGVTVDSLFYFSDAAGLLMPKPEAALLR